jgi:hypothetical protein
MNNALFTAIGPVPFIDGELQTSVVPIVPNIRNAKFIIFIELTLSGNTVVTETEGSESLDTIVRCVLAGLQNCSMA